MEIVILIVVASIIAILRTIGVVSPFYQAIAHLFVGGLFGAWVVNRNRVLIQIVIALTIIEIICFLLFRFRR